MSSLEASRDLVEQLVRSILTQQLGNGIAGNGSAGLAKPNVVANISARHCHLTQEDVNVLFGEGQLDDALDRQAVVDQQQRMGHATTPSGGRWR